MRHSGLPALLCSFVVLTGLAAVGCDSTTGKNTPPITAPSGGTTTISGVIVSAPNVPPSLSTGATVGAVGSNNFVSIDNSQAFTLTNVPTNTDVVLVFNGTGLNTRVPIGVINFADKVVLVFARTGDTLVLDRTIRGSAVSDIIGRIDSISFSDRSFIVLGRTIRTDAFTVFLRSDGTVGSFFDLFVGLGVRVAADPAPSSAVLAKTVRLEDLGQGATVILVGPVVDFTGTSTDFRFIVQGRLVRGNETTTFGDGRTFSGLFNGVQVEVAGIVRVGFIQATGIRFPN